MATSDITGSALPSRPLSPSSVSATCTAWPPQPQMGVQRAAMPTFSQSVTEAETRRTEDSTPSNISSLESSTLSSNPKAETDAVIPAKKRLWAPKVKTGCSTCRRRHIKCDETKPACNRCTQSRRRCGGYAFSTLTAATPMLFCGGLSVRDGPPGIRCSAMEKRISSLLCNDTVKEISGPFDQEFWTQSVLRATKVYPAVWHACLALSALHTRTKITGTCQIARLTRGQYYEFALQEYNASIKHIVEITREPNPSIADQEALLLANMLFIGISSIQRDYYQVVRHSQGGLQLFHHWKFWRRPDDHVALQANRVLEAKELVSQYAYVEAQFINRLGHVRRPPWCEAELPDRCNLEPYRSVTDAYLELQGLLIAFLQGAQYFGASLQDARALPSPDWAYRYRTAFRSWESKFKDFQESKFIRPSDRKGIPYLQLIWLGIEMFITVDHTKGESVWDDHLPQFQKMAKLAQDICTSSKPQPTSDSSKPIPTSDSTNPKNYSYSLSMYICEVLYFTGFSCRDATVRRSVIRLLRQWPRRDGLWDSKMIAAILEAIMDLEENATTRHDMAGLDCNCVPETYICVNHRVCTQNVQFLEDGTAMVALGTVYTQRNKLPPIMITIQNQS